MITILAAAAVAAQLTMPPVLSPAAPKPVCNIKTVSYKFTGAPGTEFRYDGSQYVIPKSGWIELIASKKSTQADFNGNHVQLDLFPLDDFGARTIPLSTSSVNTNPNSKGE